jgi:hypothetical protein
MSGYLRLLTVMVVFVAPSIISMTTNIYTYERPAKYKEMVVNISDLTSVKVTITLTTNVDSCNQHSLMTNIQNIGSKDSGRYLVELNLMSTEMYCSNPKLHSQELSHSFVVRGSRLSIFIPEEAQVRAELISE